MLLRFLFLLALILVPVAARAYEPPAAPAPRPFAYPNDTFDFKNETIWNYANGSLLADDPHAKPKEYTGRCFVLARASVQFWKFARFDPLAPLVEDAELARRIRQVCARSVWLPALAAKDRIVIPGYRDLRSASHDRRFVFEANIGLSWPFYFRPGNYVITFWVTRALEDRLNGEIYHDLRMNTPTIIWAYRFPSLKMNHVIVVHSGARDPRTGIYHYLVYDTNYRDADKHLDYDPGTRTFTYQPVYYFKGGPVTVRSIYRGLMQ